jgi:hypothetical protein
VTASISQKSAVAIGLGAIIGAGIFVLSGTAIALAGEFALLSFVLVGVVALIVAFELGELGCLMPNAQGASYSYIRGAFGNEMGFISGILLYFSYVSSVPVIALGFSDYFASLLGFSDYEYQIMIALTLVAVLSLVNILGISKAAKAELGLVSFKIFVLAILVSFAFVLSFQQHFANISNFASLPGQKNLGAVFAASVAIFFAYAGFQSISTVSSEVRGGAKGAARAIIYAVSISLVLYVLVAISLIFLAPATSYGISGDPIAYALENSGPDQNWSPGRDNVCDPSNDTFFVPHLAPARLRWVATRNGWKVRPKARRANQRRHYFGNSLNTISLSWQHFPDSCREQLWINFLLHNGESFCFEVPKKRSETGVQNSVFSVSSRRSNSGVAVADGRYAGRIFDHRSNSTDFSHRPLPISNEGRATRRFGRQII